jgi:transposase
MGRRKLPYPPEFREEAVRLVREGGKSIGQVAKDLGIADQSLRNWTKQVDLGSGCRTDGLTTEERAELRRLRRKNRVLKEGRAILVKAAALFAQETHSKPGRPSSS